MSERISSGRRNPQAHPSLNATAASLFGFLHEGPVTGWELVALARSSW